MTDPRTRHLARKLLDGDEMLTVAEIAALFRVSRAQTARWLKAGRFPDLPDGTSSVIRIGDRGVYRVRASVVRGLLDGTLTPREAPDDHR